MDQNNQSSGSVLRMAAATMVGVLCSIAGASLVLCMAGGSVVLADTPSKDPYGAVSSHVTLAGLDLAKPADVAIARERIHLLARKLCDRVEDPLSLSHQPDFVACIDAAMAKAEIGLQRLAAEKVREAQFAGR
jgi:UrcA family protein